MADVLTAIVLQLPLPDADERISKRLADYEYRHLRSLERTRILVRFGPALGLMGTLIPLSPRLSGLAHGNVTALTSNLQVAFSVTVTGTADRRARVLDLADQGPPLRAGLLRRPIRRRHPHRHHPVR
jgi:hypothetical protein